MVCFGEKGGREVEMEKRGFGGAGVVFGGRGEDVADMEC